MIDLKEIQTVNPTHTIVKYQQPLPNHPIDKNKWYDRYNIYYSEKSHKNIYESP